jgi:YVTN family beta-propeller protein
VLVYNQHMSGVTLGDTVADCRIDAVAGRGGMGVVYRATQLRLDRSVALKAIVPEMATDAAFRARFQRESRLAASIEHPNVLPVYEAGELEDGALFLVMRWVEGTDLGSLLRREERLQPRRAVALLAPVARALDAAHTHGLVHRDVKPANVLIAHPGEGAREHVYLTDFGIARGVAVDQAVTRTGVFVGTLAYAAPERIAGEQGGPASDIYSLGCMLFEVLTGHLPYIRTSELAAIHAHLHDPPPSARAEVGTTPEPLDEVIRVAMCKNPEGRFATAAEMARAMEDACPASAIETSVPAASQTQAITEAPGLHRPAHHPPITAVAPRLPAARAERRRRVQWMLAAAGVAGIAGVGFALASNGGGAKKPARPGREQGTLTASLPKSVRVSVITQLPAGVSPGAVLPLGPDTVVADPSRGRLLIVHGDGRPSSAIAVGRRPIALALDTAGRIWVVDAGSADVRVVDPVSRRSLATIPVGPSPAAIAIGGGFAWVADARSNSVYRLDVSTRRASGPPIPTRGAGAVAIAYDPAGTVWVANRGSSDVTAIRGGRAGQPLYMRGRPESIAASGGAWVGTADGSLVHLDLSGQPVGPPVALHGGRVIVSMVGSGVWALTRDDATLRLIATTGAGAGDLRLTRVLTPAEAPAQLSCALRVCVVSDTATRFIVAARF